MFYKCTLLKWKYRVFSVFVIVFCASNCVQITAQDLQSVSSAKYSSSFSSSARPNTANDFIRDGAVDSTFSALPAETGSGTVNAILRLPDGKTLIGGNIPSIAGAVTKDVVRLNPDGTPDLSFNTGTGSNGIVRKLHLQVDGKILVSGQFSVFNGVSRYLIVRLNQDGSVDTSFNMTAASNSSTTDALVCAIQPDGKIIVCGNFTSINGTARRQIARLDSSGNLDTSFDYGTTPSYYVNTVRLLPDGKMLIGRIPSSGFGVVRLNSDGSLDTTFNLALGAGFVYDLSLLPDGRFYVSGEGVSGYRIFRFNADGSLDFTFGINNTFDSLVRAVIPQPDGKVIAVGDFDTVSVSNVGRASCGIARLNGDGEFDTSFASPVDGAVTFDEVYTAALEPDGKIIIGGTFSRLLAAPISALARINGDGSLDNSFQGRILKRGAVYSQYIFPNGKIFVGGSFNMLNLAARQLIGRLNPDGDVDNSFVTGETPAGFVRTVAKQPDGKFLAGGGTTTFGDKAMWRVNADGSFDASFNVTFNTNASVLAIAVQPDGRILVGGIFNSVNGVARPGFARLNSDGSVDSFSVSFGTGGGSVNGITLQPDGRIIISGGFSAINGMSGTARVARLNADGSVDASFTSNTGGNYSSVNGLHQLNGKVFVAGTFFGSPSGNRSPLIKLNENGTVDWSFNAGTIVGNVSSAAQLPNGKIMMGGDFNSFGESGNRRYLVRLLENGSLDYTFDAGTFTSLLTNQPVTVNQVGVTPNNKVLISGSFDQIAGQTRWSVARFKADSCVTRAAADFDGDGKTDVSVFRPSNGVWYRMNSSSNSLRTYQFGLATDKIVSADYDGDGRTDIAVFRPTNGTWYIVNSGNGSFRFEQFGANGDLPYPADFDGDGRADLAVFRPSNGTWYLLRSREGFTGIQFGQQNDVPVSGDYDGDCKSDVAVFRPSNGQWWYLRTSDGQVSSLTFGVPTDKPVPADYTGDGRTDVAVWRPSNGFWYVLRSEDYSYFAVPFGASDDVPAPGDYDGDGRADAAVFRPTNSVWYLQRSTTGFTALRFGDSTDKPIPGALIP